MPVSTGYVHFEVLLYLLTEDGSQARNQVDFGCLQVDKAAW